MKFLQLLQVLWARRWFIFLVFAVIVTAVAVVSINLPKVYVGSVSVVADSRSFDPVTGSQQPAQLVTGLRATQIDVITSRTVAEKVVEKLKLDENPWFSAKPPQAAGSAQGGGDPAQLLMSRLSISPSRESNVFVLHIEDGNPVLAADIANAYADAYIETSLALQMDPMKRQAAWFDDQLQGLRAALETAQGKLSAYQQQESIVGASEQLDVENARLAEIASQLVGAQAQMVDAQTRLRQATQHFDTDRLGELPDILGNPLLQSMKADLVRAEGKLAEVVERYDRNHPQYISAAAEVSTLRNRLATELRTARGSIGQTAEIAQRRASEMQRALDTQRDRILALQQQRDGLDVLKREVENAQRAYEAGLQRSSEMGLQSQLNQSSIAVLNRAVPPAMPERPNIIFNILLATVLGSIFAAGLALSIELFDRRVRSSADLVSSGRLVVLGELPRLPRMESRRRLPRKPPPDASLHTQPA